MATDVFGDSSLFEEFEKERLPQSSYIQKQNPKKEDDGEKHIVFKLEDFESDEECSSNESDMETMQQQQQNSPLTKNSGTSEPEHIIETKAADDYVPEGSEIRKEEIPIPFGSAYCESESVLELTKELEKRKRFTKLLDSTKHVPDEEGPAVQIIFQNNTVARKYRNQIEQYITNIIQQEKHNPETLPTLRLKASTLSTAELNPENDKDDSFNTWSSHSIIGCSQIYSEFSVDTLGWPLVEHTPALTDGWEIPTYEQVYRQALPCDDEEDAPEGPAKRPARPKATCFNCGESHMLSECPQPKDQAKIRQNRRQFLEQNSSPGSLSKGLGSQTRYHIEDDPRFSGFKPGVISDELRQAMGLKSQQVPNYIYKMRLLGYPPGWLQDVEERTSGISLFDKHGNEVDLNGKSLEDGEMGPEEKQPEIDPTKIIEYEGFTVPLSEDKIDECEYLGMPPIQPHQLKKYIEIEITNQKKLKRQSQEAVSHGGKRQKLESEGDDMDLDSDTCTPAKPLSTSFTCPPPLPLDTPPCNPPLPDGTPPPTPPVSQGQGRALSFGSANRLSQSRSVRSSVERSGDETSRSETMSDSLEDLESQYKVIMQQLASEEGEESDIMVVDSCEGNGEEKEEGEVSQDESQTSDGTKILAEELEETSSTSNPPSFSDPATATIGENFIAKPRVSISKDYGTPILEASALSSLPDPEKFGSGITDHIPFENLPDATGTFEKLKDVLGRIRDKVSFSKKNKKSSS